MIRPRMGFNLVQLLIVLAILGFLFAAGAMAAFQARKAAAAMEGKNNVRQIATACLVAQGFNNNRMPPAMGKYGLPGNGQAQPFDANLFVHLLPYLEEKPLFDRLADPQKREAAANGANLRFYHSSGDPTLPNNPNRFLGFVANIRVFSSVGSKTPDDKALKMADVVSDHGGVMGTDRIPDGPSNTIFFTTKYALCDNYQNFFDALPTKHEAGKPGISAPFFGAGAFTLPPAKAAKKGGPYPAYQIAPLEGPPANQATCNADHGIYGHSIGEHGLTVGLGDTSVRNVSLKISSETYNRALCPNDGRPLGADW